VRHRALRRPWKGAKGEPWSRKGAGCDLTPSRTPAGRIAVKSERRHRGSPPAYNVEQVVGSAARAGVSIKPQMCPGAEPRLFITHLGLDTSVGYGPSLLSGARQGPTMSFLTVGSSPGRKRGLWPLGQLGRAHRATFGPVALSAH
jgi:hypothetical protein